MLGKNNRLFGFASLVSKMSTEEMKYRIAYHFHHKLNYPLVTCECGIGSSNYADVLAVKEEVVSEIEIKQNKGEIFQDLKTKPEKHNLYLKWDDAEIVAGNRNWHKYTRPNRFYFAIPWIISGNEMKLRQIIEKLPKPYGLITVSVHHYEWGKCAVVKRGRYLTKDRSQIPLIKTDISQRLTNENLHFRKSKLKER